MIAAIERKLQKYARRYSEAADALQSAITDAALLGASHVIATHYGTGEQVTRAELVAHGKVRQILDQSGRLVLSVARSALADPFAPGAFDAATFAVGKLLAEAWRLRGGDR